MTTNFGKFKKELALHEIALFESIAGRELTMLGYPRMSDVPLREPTPLLRLWYNLQNRYLRMGNLSKRESWRKPREAVLKGITADLSASSTVTLVDPLEYK
jgi:hypothetical protein